MTVKSKSRTFKPGEDFDSLFNLKKLTTMKKTEKLTPEQEQKMNDVKQYWLDYIFSCKKSIDRKKCNIQIEWLYKFCGYNRPVIIYLDSPIACQLGANYLKYIFKNSDQVGDQVGAQVRAQVGAQVRAQVRDQVGAQVRDQVGAQVGAQVWAQVRDQVGAQVGDQVGAQVWDQVWDQVRDQVRDQKLEYHRFASYGSIYDYGWISFYDFFTQIGVINHKGFNEFKSIIESGIYDMIQLNGFCIVSELPKTIHRNRQNRLHCEDGPAIQFKDGFSLYYWNGVSIPSNWITDKDSITKDVILSESNAEKRRCLREIIGTEEYFNKLGGVIMIDSDVDNNGNEMVLFESKFEDDIIGKKIQYLSVVCPSTKRKYILYPPQQKSKNVWEAKASTFNKKQKEFNPLIES